MSSCSVTKRLENSKTDYEHQLWNFDSVTDIRLEKNNQILSFKLTRLNQCAVIDGCLFELTHFIYSTGFGFAKKEVSPPKFELMTMIEFENTNLGTQRSSPMPVYFQGLLKTT